MYHTTVVLRLLNLHSTGLAGYMGNSKALVAQPIPNPFLNLISNFMYIASLHFPNLSGF